MFAFTPSHAHLHPCTRTRTVTCTRTRTGCSQPSSNRRRLGCQVTRPFTDSSAPGGGGPVYAIVPPTIDEDENVGEMGGFDDDDARPMTRNQLKDKAMRVVARRGHKDEKE